MHPLPLEHPLTGNEQLCFIHIAKTAGSTLTSILDAQFDVREICPEMGYLRELLPPEKQELADTDLGQVLKDYRLIRGHFRYERAHNWLGDRALYMTMLRDPVDRVLSLYEFYKRDLERGDEKFLKTNERTRAATAGGLQNFIQHPNPEIRNQFSNRQVRQLVIYNRNQQRKLSDEQLLQSAKATLDKCAVVGLTERFQDSVFLLAYTFGWYPYTDYQSLRVAKRKSRKDGVDPDIIAAIEQTNQLDMALYQYAQALFEQRFNTMLMTLEQTYGPPRQGKLPEPDALVELLEQHYEQRYDLNHRAIQARSDRAQINFAAVPDANGYLQFTFRQPIPGTGWHRRNGRFNGLQNQGSDTFCWSGPTTTSTLDFPLPDKQNLTMRVRTVSAAAPDILDSLKLQVNQRPIPLSRFLSRGHITVMQGTIPQSALTTSRPFSRLTFTVNRTIPLTEFSPNQKDRRLIGLAFHSIQLFPTGTEPLPPEGTHFLFPTDEPDFVELAEFLPGHLKPGEKIVAPAEFAEPFRLQFWHYAQPFAEAEGVAWVILHRNYLDEVDPKSLCWTVNTLRPVLSNRVLTLFTSRLDLPAAKLLSRNMVVFWLKYWYFQLTGRRLAPK
jgi:hypothetical protein